jgi:hypothetical protein
MKDLLDTVNISMAAEGKKEAMWVDPERHPNIANTEMVCPLCVPCHKRINDHTRQS